MGRAWTGQRPVLGPLRRRGGRQRLRLRRRQRQHRIQKFDTEGSFVSAFGAGEPDDPAALYNPFGLAVDPAGYVYVGDYSYQVRKYTTAGVYVKKWGGFHYQWGWPWSERKRCTLRTALLWISSTPRAISLRRGATPARGAVSTTRRDRAGSTAELWVADYVNQRLQVFDSSGGFAREISTHNIGGVYEPFPSTVAVDSSGCAYFADTPLQ